MPVVLGKHIDTSFYQLDHRFEPVREAVHPHSQQLIAYWRACEAKGGMRMGRDIPARAIAPLLSNVMIHEPVGDWDDAIVRYAGFGLAKYFGRDVTGLRQSEIEVGDVGGTLRQLFSEARGMIAENRCRVLEHRAFNGGAELMREEVVTFPMFGSDGMSRWLLTAAFGL